MIDSIRRFVGAMLALPLVAYALINWAKTINELRRFYTNLWIWDPWDYLSHFEQYKHFDLSVLWIQHNEHREIGTEITYILDAFLFHGKQFVPEFTGITAYIAAVFIFIAATWLSAKTWPCAYAALLAFGIAGYKLCVVSLATPFLTSWPQWEFFGAAAFASIVLHQKRGGKLFLVATIAFAVCATYSMSNGMLVWPLLLLAALALRLTQRQMLSIALAGAISIGMYFFHYKNLHTINPGMAVHHPKYLVMFLASLLGMPFSTQYHFSKLIILTSPPGFLALALVAVDAFFIVRNKLFTKPPVIIMGGFCSLVLGSAIVTAVGRMNPDDPLIIAARAGRYITEPTLFWCALLLLTVWLTCRLWNGSVAVAFVAFAAVLTVATLPKNDEYYAWWENYFQRGQWAAIGMANGLTDNVIGDVIFPSREYEAQFRHVLVENRLAVFSGPEPAWIGRQASQIFVRGTDGFIHGEITTIKKLGNDFEIQGWADGASRVVFTDETDRIVGFGMRPRAGPAELDSHNVPKALAFTGFIRSEFAGHDFSLWAVDRKGNTRSRMGQLRNILPR